MNEEPAAGASQASPADLIADCPRCLKPQALCVCEGIAPIDNKVSLLILQHPQEQDRDLGTARLTVLHLKDALLKIGLSWPSLTRILGRPADPQRWAILYLGSVKAAAVLPDRDIVVVNKKGTGQGIVVAQWMDAQVQADRARAQAPLALRQVAARAAQRRALDPRSSRDAAGAARKKAGDRDGAARELRASARALSRTAPSSAGKALKTSFPNSLHPDSKFRF
jgi:hypothetical protein